MLGQHEHVPEDKHSGALFCPAEGRQRLRWSSWPCEECSRGITPIGHLIASAESNPGLLVGTPEEIALAQASELRKWASDCGHNPITESDIPLIAGGSEHLVYFDEPKSHVVKLTRPGTYGESYYIEHGRINQRNCSPLDYLLRLRLWRKLFQSAPQDLGITQSGQIVSADVFITGSQPTQEAVDKFLFDAGLTPVRQNYWLWKKTYAAEMFEVWVGDARIDNFVETPAGIVPIDIRIWFDSVDLPSATSGR